MLLLTILIMMLLNAVFQLWRFGSNVGVCFEDPWSAGRPFPAEGERVGGKEGQGRKRRQCWTDAMPAGAYLQKKVDFYFRKPKYQPYDSYNVSLCVTVGWVESVQWVFSERPVVSRTLCLLRCSVKGLFWFQRFLCLGAQLIRTVEGEKLIPKLGRGGGPNVHIRIYDSYCSCGLIMANLL